MARGARLLLVMAVSASPLLLAGCTVETGGAVGLTVTGAGEVAAVLVVCQGYLDGVTVYRDDDSDGPSVGEWDAETRITDTATIPLTEAPLDSALEQLGIEDRAAYLIYGWTEDNRWSANHERFTAADVLALRVDEVWFSTWDAETETAGGVYVPVADFREVVCADF